MKKKDDQAPIIRNPFSISFGRKPLQFIERDFTIEEIREELDSDEIREQCFMLTGVRGSGKTVTMTALEAYYRDRDDFIVVDLNTERDMLQSLVAKIYDKGSFLKKYFDTQLNLSAFGIGISVKNVRPIADIESALEKILFEMKKKKKRLLVTIDEVFNNSHMREFASSFQILIRQELPIFLVMAGLYENIHALEDEDNLTFLYRAPKFNMDPLDPKEMKNSYMQILDISGEIADQMVKMTKGYPFAYQALGKYIWDSPGHKMTEEVVDKFDRALATYVYGKIWSELSEKDRWNLRFLAQKETMKTKEFLEISGQQKNEFSQYRERLRNKGLIDVSQRGIISITLPRFADFVKKQV